MVRAKYFRVPTEEQAGSIPVWQCPPAVGGLGDWLSAQRARCTRGAGVKVRLRSAGQLLWVFSESQWEAQEGSGPAGSAAQAAAPPSGITQRPMDERDPRLWLLNGPTPSWFLAAWRLTFQRRSARRFSENGREVGSRKLAARTGTDSVHFPLTPFSTFTVLHNRRQSRITHCAIIEPWIKLFSNSAQCWGRASRHIATPSDSKSRKQQDRTDCASARLRLKSRCSGSSPSRYQHHTTCCMSYTRHAAEASLAGIKVPRSISTPLMASWRSFVSF